MNAYSADLAALRQAALAREWGSLQDILARLLPQMEFFAGLEIALTRAHNHLPAFEHYYPEETWARSLLVWIASYGATPANLPLDASAPHPSPGAANFISALIDIARSVEQRTPLENRLRFLGNALSNVLLAELAVYWYEQHPDLWEMQVEHGDEIDPQTGLTIRQVIYTQFWLDETVAQRDTAAWLEIAALLEKKRPAG